MPMKDFQAGSQERLKPGWRRVTPGGMEGGPADLWAGVTGIDTRAQGRGNELGAETDSEGWFLRLKPLADGLRFWIEKRKAGRFVDTYRSTKDDKEVAGISLGERESSCTDVDGFNGKASFEQARLQGTEVFKGNVGEDDGF